MLINLSDKEADEISKSITRSEDNRIFHDIVNGQAYSMKPEDQVRFLLNYISKLRSDLYILYTCAHMAQNGFGLLRMLSDRGEAVNLPAIHQNATECENANKRMMEELIT